MSNKTIVISGYGPGISHAVAEVFGKNGFNVVIGARNAEKLAANAKKLEGLNVLTVPTDAADEKSVRALIAAAKAKFGSVDVIHWNAASAGAGDILTAPIAEFRTVLDTGVTGLIAAVQESLPELEKNKGAVLVTDGGYGLDVDAIDEAVVQYGAMGLGIGNAAKHKLVRVLKVALKQRQVFVAEVMVTGLVKGTAWDNGSATLEASTIGAKFWELYSQRSATYAQI